jgi:proteic killer suppression protein
MWRVLEHRRVARRLSRLSVDILKRYEKWKDIVIISGPAGVRRIKGFRDEVLCGEWKGARASRLSDQYRIIYSLDIQKVAMKVIDLTAHDYRRK